jgi:hypothetical protein
VTTITKCRKAGKEMLKAHAHIGERVFIVHAEGHVDRRGVDRGYSTLFFRELPQFPEWKVVEEVTQ